MPIGRRKEAREQELFVCTDDLPKTAARTYYRKLNRYLSEASFDRKIEAMTEPYYAARGGSGRPSIPPGIYVRMLLVGYLEGIGSERGIALRCADSLALREFLGFSLTDRTPDHSTISGTRRRLPVEWHEEVFALLTSILAKKRILKGDTLAIDASTIEANAAMRSIVRKDTAQSYPEYVEALAKASGVTSPTAAELQRFDRKRKGKKLSNDDWEHPEDPDAKITRMKDGRTKMGYKVEHAVDTDSGAIVAGEVHEGDDGDTTSGPETIERAQCAMGRIKDHVADFETTRADVVMDKGYFKGEWLVDLERDGYRPYVAEPEIGRRRWTRKGVLTDAKARERDAVYANRRRTRGNRGRRLARKRSEIAERSFAHMLTTGGFRRTWLRGRDNIAKRYHLHAAGHNLAILMRRVFGVGTPRGLSAAVSALKDALSSTQSGLQAAIRPVVRFVHADFGVAHFKLVA
jgi:transposase